MEYKRARDASTCTTSTAHYTNDKRRKSSGTGGGGTHGPTPPPPIGGPGAAEAVPPPPELSPQKLEAIETIMVEHVGYRKGLLRAVTVDADALMAMLIPHGWRMCLTASPDGRWHYGPLSGTLPPRRPLPVAGINRAVTYLHHPTDWLAYVAVHSDAWLFAQAFHGAAQARLGPAGRAALFARLNQLPTLHEEVRAWRRPGGGGGRPAGETEPPPPGPLLTRGEVTRALRGRVGYVYHPEHDRWYVATFTRVAPTLGTADIRLVRGGMETVDVLGLVERKHVVMIT